MEVRQLQNGSSEQSWVFACDLPNELENLTATNLLGWNIYVGANPRPDFGVCKDVNIQVCRCLFADFDKPHFPDDCTDRAGYAKSKATKEGLPQPTMVIDSGHGIHLYWRFAEPIEPERWRKGMRLLSSALGSDTAIGNAERVMRLPGLMNNKPPAAPCRILEHDPARMYALSDFSSLRTPQTPEPCVQPPREIRRTGSDEMVRSSAYADKWENLLEGDGRNQALYRHVKQLHNDLGISLDTVRQVVREWNQGNNPPLDDREFASAFDSALKYASKKPAGCGNETKSTYVPTPPIIVNGEEVNVAEDAFHNRFSDIKDGTYSSVGFPDCPTLNRLSQPNLPGLMTILYGEGDSAKSQWSVQETLEMIRLGIPVTILMSEQDEGYWMCRVMALLSGNTGWMVAEMVKNKKDYNGGYYDYDLDVEKYAKERGEFGKHLTVYSKNMPDLSELADIVDQKVKAGARIIYIDAVTLFKKGRPGESIAECDENFLRKIEGSITESICSALLVTHPTKAAQFQDMAGGAIYRRRPKQVYKMIQAPHGEPFFSLIKANTTNSLEELEHTHILYVEKCNQGPGKGCKIAYRMLPDFGLQFEEVGLIKKILKRKD